MNVCSAVCRREADGTLQQQLFQRTHRLVKFFEQALGPDRIQQIAGRLGMDPKAMKERLAEVLPTVVDKMTPKGKIEEEEAS